MKRTKQLSKKVHGIFTGDWHGREDQPICRTDDFQKAQWAKISFINDLQRKYNCPVLHSGDLFNHWKPSPYLLSKIIELIPDKFITNFGNHDLPQHALELAYKCGVNTLLQAEKIILFTGTHWGQEPRGRSYFDSVYNRSILVWHVMTWTGSLPWPGCIDIPAEEILEKYQEYDLILTGHNHKSFVVEQDGRLLVNPGSLTRQKADQEEHEPCVYLWHAEDNTVTKVILPFEKDVISREHIEKIQKRDDRIMAFIEKLCDDWETGISFEDNMERFLATNTVRKSVIQIIQEALDQ